MQKEGGIQSKSTVLAMKSVSKAALKIMDTDPSDNVEESRSLNGVPCSRRFP